MAIVLDVDCPECGEPYRIPDPEERSELGPCPACGETRPMPDRSGRGADASFQCLACDGDALYRTKIFPRKIGLGVIALAGVLMFWFDSPLPIVGAAVLDGLLFLVLPDVAVCYRCHSHHRGAPSAKALDTYDLELASTFEKGIPWVKKRHLNHPSA